MCPTSWRVAGVAAVPVSVRTPRDVVRVERTAFGHEIAEDMVERLVQWQPDDELTVNAVAIA